MLQIAGAIEVNKQTTISAVKKRPSGAQHRRKRRGGENVLWHRVTENFDEAIKRFAANPEMAGPITRLVFFKHLTVRQGMAARRYRDVVQTFNRYHVDAAGRTARSANLEPSSKGKDDTLHRELMNGTIADYEADARKAKREYKRLTAALATYADPVSGRNKARDLLDDLCLADVEPPAEWRENLAVVLDAIAKEFGGRERRS